MSSTSRHLRTSCPALAAVLLTATAPAQVQPPPPRADRPAEDSGRPPTELEQELNDAKTPFKNWAKLTENEDPLGPLETWTRSVEDRTGLKLGGAYTMLLQQASGGPGRRTAAGGDVDLLASWKFPTPDEKNFGRISFSAEYRHQIGDLPPSELGKEIGTLVGTTNGFGERPPVVKEFFYEQRLADGALRFILGRIDSENYIGGHRLQSANTSFLNKAFSSNPTIPYPSIGLGAGAAILPTKWMYLLGGVTDANASITRTGFDTAFDTGEVFTFVELGYIPEIAGLGPGRYRLSFWHMDERREAGKPEDSGFSITLDQDFGKWTVFSRGAYSDNAASGVQGLGELGAAVRGLGSENDLTGLAFAYAVPPDDRRDEKIFEVFHRFQLALRLQFTIGAQLILDPSNAPDDDALGVFSARLRFSF